MRSQFPTFSAEPLTYADETVGRADRSRRRANRRRRWRRIVLWTVVVALVGGGVYARHAFIQSYRESAGVKLGAGDELVDVEVSGWNDRDDYFELRLSVATYQRLFADVTTRLPGRKTSFPAKWPWRVPSDAIIREGEYESYMFSPSSRTVYVRRWSM